MKVKFVVSVASSACGKLAGHEMVCAGSPLSHMMCLCLFALELYSLNLVKLKIKKKHDVRLLYHVIEKQNLKVNHDVICS